MNALIKRSTILLLTIVAVGFSACKDSGNNGPAPVEAMLAEDIAANYNTLTETREPIEDVNDHPSEEGRYTFFDLDSGDTVTDSTSAEWDLAFDGTTILANSGNGGGILLVDTPIADLETAPEVGYESSNADWYTYTDEAPGLPQHAILADTTKTLVVLTPDGNYAKVQILSYYEGNPDTSTEEFASFMTRPASGYFTFNYTLQTDGTTKLFHVDAYTFFDFETGDLVEDSLSTQWDLGFNGTNIIANYGNGGGVQLLNIAFEDVDEAPTEGYEESNSDWYTYTMNNIPMHSVLPNDGQTLVVLTADGKYAKVKILSYYKGNPDTSSDDFINFIRPADRHYTFEYAIQTDGSRFFE